jgi:membrane protease YdiL (CAAX protease family)
MKALIILPYLAISSLVPWEKISISNGFLSNIFFDAAFIIFMIKWLKIDFNFKAKLERNDVSLLMATLALAIGSIFCLISLSIPNPFIYVTWLFFNLVLVGPIIEELVFRVSFNDLYPKNLILKHLSSGAVFSLSHSISMINAPKSWYTFFYVQIIYTFFLGVICSISFNQRKNAIKPIALHIIFNTIFFIVTVTKLYKIS